MRWRTPNRGFTLIELMVVIVVVGVQVLGSGSIAAAGLVYPAYNFDLGTHRRGPMARGHMGNERQGHRGAPPRAENGDDSW